MAKISINANWKFELDAGETRLVLKALGGRLLTAEEREAAKRLGDELTIMRAESADLLANQMDIHASKVEAER